MEACKPALLGLALLTVPLVGCIGGSPIDEQSAGESQPSNATDYQVPERNPGLELIETSRLFEADVGDVSIHVRIVRPDVDEPVPVIAEFTPYNAPGRAMLVEPRVSPPSGTYVEQFVQRGFAFAFADARGTSDSGGCLDLRGSVDVEDAGALTAFLGEQDWSNGNVGFIGASYPGSMAHIAGIADDPHLGGIVPIVASTSFYDYHHNDGVPYDGHELTNVLYNGFHAAPSSNPQNDNWLTKHAYQARECEQADQILRGFDDSGTYDAWWKDRDLNHRIDEIDVPVLMAQGLGDWNVKPDHIDPWFNRLDANKTLIAGQWGHAYPADAEEAYGDWWSFATAFFDQTLDGAQTGMFEENKAYVQDDTGTWHTYNGSWPPGEAETLTLNLTAEGLSTDEAPSGNVSWQAPRSSQVESAMASTEVVLESQPLPRQIHLSGSPRLNLTVVADQAPVHLVAVLETDGQDQEGLLGSSGTVRENYGYLNPRFREGLTDPQRVIPGEPTPVTIDMYPQEDVLEEGQTLRLVLSSTDDGRTEESFEPGLVTAVLDGERPGQLHLPTSPLTD